MASPPRSATSERPAEGFATPPVPPLTLADEYAPRSATDSDVGTFFDVANFALESGLVMPQVQVSYRSWGLLNAERDNASNVVVKVDPAINLDGPYLNNTLASTIRLDISANNWGLHARQTALPEQLRPHQVGQRVESNSAPVIRAR